MKSPSCSSIITFAPFFSKLFTALLTVLMVIEFCPSLSAAMMIFSPAIGS
ncbi:hypothetical protein [Candidatus Orientia mediorientalis]|nr:hypothetical protein [Candidatus Orientia mediorientalis]